MQAVEGQLWYKFYPKKGVCFTLYMAQDGIVIKEKAQ
jgi:hypothetical protein